MKTRRMPESPEELVKKFRYTREQAEQIHSIFSEESKKEREIGLQIFQLANKYLESAAALGKHIESAKNANVAPGQIMCLSMALELYFKSLVTLDYSDVMEYSGLPAVLRKKMETHHIPSIFDLISDQHKNRLADIFSARLGVPRLGISEFRAQLVEKASKIFVEWRYVYENDSGTFLHLDLLPVHHLIVASHLVAIEAKRK
jgi:hypothetical protein